MAGTPARGYSWEPFQPGNQAALLNGSYSPRHIEPLAAQILTEARTADTWPAYLNDPTYNRALKAWAWTEAICELLRQWLADMDIQDAATETTTTTDDEETTETHRRRVSVSKRVTSALERLAKYESIASSHRSKLGLDPLSRAKLGKDVAAANLDLAQYWAKEDQAANEAGKRAAPSAA